PAAWRRPRPGRRLSRCRARASARRRPPLARSPVRSRSTGCGPAWARSLPAQACHGLTTSRYVSSAQSPAGYRTGSILLDAYDLRVVLNHTLFPDRLQGAPHRILAGRVGDQDDGRRRIRALRIVAAVRPRAAMALHDRFERDLLVGEQPGDRRKRSRAVDRGEADVVAALVPLPRRPVSCREPAAPAAAAR